MTKTFFFEDNKRVIKNLVVGYSSLPKLQRNMDLLDSSVVGAANLHTTHEDFYKYDLNFYNNRLGRGGQGLIDLFLRKGRLNNGQEIPYAFGVFNEKINGIQYVHHAGSYTGYRTNGVI
jgi:hypothetical protein